MKNFLIYIFVLVFSLQLNAKNNTTNIIKDVGFVKISNRFEYNPSLINIKISNKDIFIVEMMFLEYEQVKNLSVNLPKRKVLKLITILSKFNDLFDIVMGQENLEKKIFSYKEENIIIFKPPELTLYLITKEITPYYKLKIKETFLGSKEVILTPKEIKKFIKLLNQSIAELKKIKEKSINIDKKIENIIN